MAVDERPAVSAYYLVFNFLTSFKDTPEVAGEKPEREAQEPADSDTVQG
jgi:hypothetical protein